MGNQLKFNDQATKICKKVSKQLGVMRPMKKLLPTNTKELCIEPLFHHTFCLAQKYDDKKRKEINERALRFIFNDKSSEYDKLLKKISMPSLANRKTA